jgi:hypothetical protein
MAKYRPQVAKELSEKIAKTPKPKEPQRALTRYRNQLRFKNNDTLEVLGEYIKTYGMEKYVKEMMQLEGKDYHAAFSRLAEHFLPKLQKTENTIAITDKIQLNFQPALQVCPHCGRDLYEEPKLKIV